MRRDGWLDAASAIRFDAPNAFKLPRLAHPMCQHTIVIIPLGSQLKHTTQQWHLWQTSPSCCIRQHPNKNYRTCWLLPSPASHHTWAATRTNHFCGRWVCTCHHACISALQNVFRSARVNHSAIYFARLSRWQAVNTDLCSSMFWPR